MENNDTASVDQSSKVKITPRELIKKHMEENSQPITDEDLDNLKIGSNAEGEDKIKAMVDRKLSEFKNHSENDGLLNAYNILDNK